MAKFIGKIGYVKTVETAPGVYQETFEERNYRGDLIRNTKRWEKGESINDNLTISNSISIVSDDFATQNVHNMRYVTWGGASWKITSVEIQRPRLILSIGGVYNGPKS